LLHTAIAIWSPKILSKDTLEQRISALRWLTFIPYSLFEWMLFLFFPIALTLLFAHHWHAFGFQFKSWQAIAMEVFFNLVVFGVNRRKAYISDMLGRPVVISSFRRIAQLHFLGSAVNLTTQAYRDLLKQSTSVELLIALKEAGFEKYQISSHLMTLDVFSRRVKSHLESLPNELVTKVQPINKRSPMYVTFFVSGLRLVNRLLPSLFEKLSKQMTLKFLCTAARKLNDEKARMWMPLVEPGFELKLTVKKI